VRLKTEALVELNGAPGKWQTRINGKDVESGLAVETVKHALKMAGKESSEFSGVVETTTECPIGVGLKSSSSSSVAIALAVSSALGNKAFDPQRVLNCSVEASLGSGASVTGALDDAASCLLGGLNLADNLARKIMYSKLFDKELVVVIKVPDTQSRRSMTDVGFVRKFGKISDLLFRMSMEGDVWRAMILNGVVYSSIYGYDPSPALRAVELGALGSGLSGTGPAVAAVFDQDNRDAVSSLVRDWGADGSKVIETRTNNEHGGILAVA
jgi:shikimate kinase